MFLLAVMPGKISDVTEEHVTNILTAVQQVKQTIDRGRLILLIKPFSGDKPKR
jgi:hypothetical protein